ncbi:InlB B-repeat-containing protein, partial [Listeria seeligeri]|uniref:InlB B-repeat-containing protein n=1 Tax=Listeria seeligeri TaxID=1640 RepID=UPI0022EAFE4C
MKKLMYLVLFLTVFISVGLGEEVIPSMEAQADTLAQPTPINQIFPDSNFATVVAESFEPDKNVNDVVTSTDLSSVITVSGGNRNIQSIEGVQYLTGVRHLDLFSNYINNISPLANADLPNLVRLDLGYNQVSDFSPLISGDFPQFFSLNLQNNHINDISFLADVDFPLLNSLFLGGNQINDLTPLENAHFPILKTLELNTNEVRDIRPLTNGNFPEMTRLKLEENQIDDISSLASADFPKLEYLYLDDNQIMDISSLASADIPEISSLGLAHNQIADITPLANANCSKVEHLFLQNNQIANIEPLENATFTNLFSVYLENQTIINEPIPYQRTLTIENVVTTIDGSIVPPASITNGGQYTNPTIEWSLPNFIGEVSYTFNEPLSIGTWIYDSFSGTVIQPLAAPLATQEVVFNVDGIETREEVGIGTQLTEPAAPTKEGYTFTGWYDAPTGGNPWDFTTGKMPANDLTLYAQFTKNRYQVTFTIDGETTLQLMDYEAQLTEPAAPTKEGYTFTGWYDAP